MRVGTRRLNELFKGDEKDHPHACGDKVIMDFPEIQNEGSSPCVWGQVSF